MIIFFGCFKGTYVVLHPLSPSSKAWSPKEVTRTLHLFHLKISTFPVFPPKKWWSLNRWPGLSRGRGSHGGRPADTSAECHDPGSQGAASLRFRCHGNYGTYPEVNTWKPENEHSCGQPMNSRLENDRHIFFLLFFTTFMLAYRRATINFFLWICGGIFYTYMMGAWWSYNYSDLIWLNGI